MKKLVMTVAAAGMLVAGLAAWPGAAAADTTAPGATSTRAPEYSPPPIAWGQCASASACSRPARSAACSTVPLDYAKPHGAKIKLAVSRIMHKTSDANSQGVMLVNPGGPGGSGLGLSRLGAFVPNNGGDPYDWIGFDPRGVGSSRPSLSCDADYFGGDRPDVRPEHRGSCCTPG